MKVISVELYGNGGWVYRYDASNDGPLSEWLLSIVPKLGGQFNGTVRNSTIRVFERSE